jgi:hypothetical protein
MSGRPQMKDWDQFNRKGGKSGNPTDYQSSNQGVHLILQTYLDYRIDTILDTPCGDMQLWKDIDLPDHYVGVDISRTIINRNKARFQDATFINAPASQDLNLTADGVICIALLWHIMDDIEYQKTLENLARLSRKYLFINTWNCNPLDTVLGRVMQFKNTGKICLTENITDGYNQTYRKFAVSDPVFKNFDLLKEYRTPIGGCGSIYVFERKPCH